MRAEKWDQFGGHFSALLSVAGPGIRHVSAEKIAGFFENEFGHASLLVSENEIQYLKYVIESRLMCPACGSRRVTVVFEPPSNYQVGSV